MDALQFEFHQTAAAAAAAFERLAVIGTFKCGQGCMLTPAHRSECLSELIVIKKYQEMIKSRIKTSRTDFL